MSECVVRMEMPKACSWVDNGILKRCPLLSVGGLCRIERRIDYQDNSRPSWCPIICQLPEGHGRLVEESEVIRLISKWFDVISLNPDILIDGIKSATTIVPAEAKRSET